MGILINAFSRLEERAKPRITGTITNIGQLILEAKTPRVFVGELCYVEADYPEFHRIPCEVVGIRDGTTLLMPFPALDNLSLGARVVTTGHRFRIRCGPGMLGRVLDGMGNPVDGKGDLEGCPQWQDVNQEPPRPLKRPLIRDVIFSGIKAIDTMLTWGKGQRLGVFSGSGVGKSTLFGMIARNSSADINIIGLIGERGREVREFIDGALGEEGLKRSVVVTVTSDESPIMRMKGALVLHAIAEYFRDEGNDVLMLVDSLTRFTYALREIGLSMGEPPTTRGYTPSVYARIPRLCERCGITEKGSITGLYTVLVEGDDISEPVSDIARSVLDGHITLTRKLAERNHYPPIDVLQSISRVMTDIVSPEHIAASTWAREVLATYRDAEDLINIGAYTRGNNAKIDYAIDNIDRLNAFLRQDRFERIPYREALDDFLDMTSSKPVPAT
ncbi:FliI/YscN family ATPase [bacterium]|nr:FliI/YscN family ATPase [bacterium]